MAKLPPINRIVKEDFPQESWAEKLLWPINRFFETVYSAMNRNLTLSDNTTAAVRSISFNEARQPFEFAFETNGRPTDVVMTSISDNDGSDITTATSMYWTLGESVVRINIVGLSAAKDYTARFLLLSEG